MKFELGKFYRHTTGLEASIVGIAETTLYGTCYVAETNKNADLQPYAMNSENATANWTEITKEEWMKNFSK